MNDVTKSNAEDEVVNSQIFGFFFSFWVLFLFYEFVAHEYTKGSSRDLLAVPSSSLLAPPLQPPAPAVYHRSSSNDKGDSGELLGDRSPRRIDSLKSRIRRRSNSPSSGGAIDNNNNQQQQQHLVNSKLDDNVSSSVAIRNGIDDFVNMIDTTRDDDDDNYDDDDDDNNDVVGVGGGNGVNGGIIDDDDDDIIDDDDDDDVNGSGGSSR